MRKLILMVMGVLCAIAACQSQSPPLHALAIGERLPDITLKHIFNYKNTKATLSNFKGKPLILDFFATWCGSCIGALPKLDSLQRAFDDSLQILVIDYESADRVKMFLKNNPVGQGIRLPFVADDSLLSYIVFPHRSIPHEIWIDADGIVRTITLPEYVTTKNLRSLINKEPLGAPVKNDMMHFDNQKLLFVDGNGGSVSQIRFRSTLAGYIDGLGPKMGIHKDSLTKGIFQINRPVVALYSEAVRGIGNRLILEVRDKKHYINDRSLPWDQWAEKNDYSYELVAPLNTPDSVLQQWMLRDLNRWLNLDARWEKRMVSCWALVMKNKNGKGFKTTGGKPELDYGDERPVKVFRNEPLDSVVETWNEQMPSKPLVPLILNETGYSGNVDLELHVPNLHNITALRKALHPYGLDLVSVQRKLKMFVITEKNNKTSSGRISLGIN